MVRAGSARSELAQTLTCAYGAGLLSELTLAHRLEQLFSRSLLEPTRLVGDLPAARAPGRLRGALRRVLAEVRARVEGHAREQADGALLLALDWCGAQEELVIGRDPRCEVVLGGPHVSRRHARLRFCDGVWAIQDLGSTNGTLLNGAAVARARLRPGDLLSIGACRLRVD